MEQSKKQQLADVRKEVKAYWEAATDAELSNYHGSSAYESLVRRSLEATSVVDATTSAIMHLSPSGLMTSGARHFFLKNREEISNKLLELLEREI